MNDADKEKLAEKLLQIPALDAGERYIYGCGFTDAIDHRDAQQQAELYRLVEAINDSCGWVDQGHGHGHFKIGNQERFYDVLEIVREHAAIKARKEQQDVE